MIPPLFTLVGRPGSRGARLSAVFPTAFLGPLRSSRLAWRVNGAAQAAIDHGEAGFEAAPPYAIARFDLDGLPPGARIDYAIGAGSDATPVAAPEALLAGPARGSFRLLPEGRGLRVALVSCNALDDATYRGTPGASTLLWRRLKALVDAEEVDLVLHLGDQIYSDGPIELFRRRRPGASEAELAAEYRRVHEDHFGTADVRAVLGSVPGVMMWDDHDIQNSFGSNDGDGDPAARAVFRAARAAFADLQAGQNPAPLAAGEGGSFAFGFVHRPPAGGAGSTGFLVLDGRSHRLWSAREVLGPAQRAAAREWLRARAAEGLAHLVVGVGIPPCFVPVRGVERLLDSVFAGHTPAADLREHWTADKNLDECAALMGLLYEFLRASPRTAVTLVAGDVHVGGTAEIRSRRPEDAAAPLVYEVFASPIAHAPNVFPGLVAPAPIELDGDRVVGELRPLPGRELRVLASRNFAVLTLGEGADRSVRVRFHFDAGGAPDSLETALERPPAPPEA